MSYEKALEAAGAKVLMMKRFGSYQGDWFAKVEFQGTIKFLRGSFGSCSVCDAFEAEFGDCKPWCDEHYAIPNSDCIDCNNAARIYDEKLVLFGREYLEEQYSFDDMMTFATRNLDWDSDAQEMVDWLNVNKEDVK